MCGVGVCMVHALRLTCGPVVDGVGEDNGLLRALILLDEVLHAQARAPVHLCHIKTTSAPSHHVILMTSARSLPVIHIDASFTAWNVVEVGKCIWLANE